jgi:phospholipase/lecithinase/hemolysin
MRLRRYLAALVAAWSLVACGGGDPHVPGSGSPAGAPTERGSFTRIVSFGDSLSDVGTYTPATSANGNGTPPFIGGKFTTNSPTSSIWVENLAAQLSLVITPAEVGFGTSSVACPAAADPALAHTCTGYGQGGARVTDPNGIDHSNGALTVPVVTQVERHLARFGDFTANDLVLVYAGSNDVSVQFAAFTTRAAEIEAAAAAGSITADEANRQLFAAQTEAQAGMKQAALELGGYVQTQILGRGAKYVAVFLLSDIVDTPFGNSLPSRVRPVLTDLSRVFNLWLTESLTDRPVRLIDTFSLYKQAYADPAAYGIANNQVPACDAAKIAAITAQRVTGGSSLFCNATPGVPYNGLRTGADPLTWQFADGVHPSTGGHKLISDTVIEQLQSFGWL